MHFLLNNVFACITINNSLLYIYVTYMEACIYSK